MPSKSKSQQRLFGMVHAYQKGDLDLKDLDTSLAKKIKSIADGKKKKTGDKREKTKGITKKAAEEYASTKHKGLPQKVEEKILNFYSYIKENKMDALKGGEAQGMSIEDVAKMHNISPEFIEKQMEIGIDIEFEHSDDVDVASRIALDHLTENPYYYDEKVGLPEMEDRLDDLSGEGREERRRAMADEMEKLKKEIEEELEEDEEENQLLDKEDMGETNENNENKDRYEDIVFIQGDEANEIYDILNEKGEEAALDYLKQWHLPNEHQTSDELLHGKNDRVYKKDGYIMSWSPKGLYFGLQYDTMHEEGVKKFSDF